MSSARRGMPLLVTTVVASLSVTVTPSTAPLLSVPLAEVMATLLTAGAVVSTL